MKAKTFSITINGKRWKYSLLNEVDYVKKHQGDSVAITIVEAHRIDFREGNATQNTIVHELLHAYCRSLHLDSTDIHWQQFEEIVCELVGENIEKILMQAKKMLANMTGGQNGKDNSGMAKGDSHSSSRQGVVSGTGETAS